jgi:oxygen-independent coproporphyrinogen-3 oxidase
MTASLYIHIPFCAGLCDYCDFYSIPAAAGDPRMDLFLDALIEDIRRQLGAFGVSRVPTVYIGGGTPSHLGLAGVDRLLSALASLLPNVPEELTLEVNPESTDQALLERCRAGGVSRLSVGVQSLHGPSRRGAGRAGAGEGVPEKLRMIGDVFGGDFSVDLITGLPYQDEGIILGDIEGVLAFHPGHVSLYALTLEEGTPLERAVRVGKRPLPRGDAADALWLAGRDALERSGYAQYEVSNFSLPGKEARHNIRYWVMENWLGAGPAASGTLIDEQSGTGRRYTFPADLEAYLERAGSSQGPPLYQEEFLDRATLIKETLLMGFRFIEGPDEGLFRKRFRRGLEETIPGTLRRWRERGLVRRDKPALTGEGLLLLNSFLLECFAELEDPGD